MHAATELIARSLLGHSSFTFDCTFEETAFAGLALAGSVAGAAVSDAHAERMTTVLGLSRLADAVMRVKQSRHARRLRYDIDRLETRMQDARLSVTQEPITSDDVNNANCRNPVVVSPRARNAARRAQ